MNWDWEIVKTWLPLISAVGAATAAFGTALWTIILYIRQQRESARARLVEAQKPFLKLQLRLYLETARVTGKLISLQYASDEWMKMKDRFWALYWSELSMVEDPIVENAMVAFREALDDYENDPNAQSTKYGLQGRSYHLAHAIRDSILTTWGGSVKSSRSSKDRGEFLRVMRQMKTP